MKNCLHIKAKQSTEPALVQLSFSPSSHLSILLLPILTTKNMKFTLINFAFFLLYLVINCLDHVNSAKIALRYKKATQNEYKMCVPEHIFPLCQEMAKTDTKSLAKIICIPARDRFECIEKIHEHIADFGTVDPEDMYIANQIDSNFGIFEEIRTKEEPDAEFRYGAVAVIRKNLNITSAAALKGLNSCHTGVGRNVGYKIPLTKLKQKGIIGTLNEPGLSARENELKALSNLFSKACIVGEWSPDTKINLEWKKKYSNLCALCEHPDKCDYPDNFSGYDGALRCLAHNNGDIAWTKVIYVRKFFGLPVGVSPARPSNENLSEYAYLCPDFSTMPISDEPCTWAARPWQGYMANADVIKTVDELRRKIENLNSVGSKTHANWLQKVLELNDKTIPKENKVISPGDYLDKANYTDVIERDYGPPFKSVRFCVVTSDELAKCRALSRAAFSRNIRPRFDCVEEKTEENCLKTIENNGADIITLDAGLVYKARNNFNLKPILNEKYEITGGSYYAVAVVRKSATFQSFSDLRGAKSCHTGLDRTAGYNAPLYTLLKLDLLNKTNCPYPKAISEFFSASCLPGATNLAIEKLCSLCKSADEKNDNQCNFDSSELYSGYSGALRCLVEGGGDVAFVKHVTVPGNTNGKNSEEWAKDLKSEDFELLCPNGGRAKVEEYEKCNLAHAPPHMVVTRNSKSREEIDEIVNALLSTSDLYSTRPDLFKLFGSFNGKKDLLFKDSAIGLETMATESEVLKEYSNLLQVINGCAAAE